jgi:hypothetical protein
VQASPTKLLKDSMMKAAEDRNGGASMPKAAEVSNKKMADQDREMSQIAGDILRDHSILQLRHPDVGIHQTKWANRKVTKALSLLMVLYLVWRSIAQITFPLRHFFPPKVVK